MRQSLKNIEIIVVNDCSPDNSEAIILEYAAKDPRIVYIKHEENKCLGGARNTGMRAARGEYIAFVDSDDYVDVTLYEAAIKAFEKYDIDAVILPWAAFGMKKRRIPMYRKYPPCLELLPQTHGFDPFYFTAWNKVYRAADLRDKNILFPEKIYYEDTPFWMDYCAAMQPRCVHLHPRDSGFYQYRQRADSITGNKSGNAYILPQISLLIYQNFKNRNRIKELFPQFYDNTAGIMQMAWGSLDDELRYQFLENFDALITRVFSDGFTKSDAPEWHLFKLINSPEEKALLMQLYADKTRFKELDLNFWYQLNFLSAGAKIKALWNFFWRRVWHFMHL